MIRNLVFDMGGVLIAWSPRRLVARLGVEGEDARLLLREVFGDQEWVGLDRGRLTEEEALARFRARLPRHLHEAARRLVYWWRDELWPVPGMEELLKELKAAGYGIYLLSNATAALHEYFPRIPGAALFDGLLVSADLGLLKPQHEIFETLFARFGLAPEESFFVDDSNVNVDGALVVGMSAAVFDGDLPRLRRALKDAGVRLGADYCESSASTVNI